MLGLVPSMVVWVWTYIIVDRRTKVLCTFVTPHRDDQAELERHHLHHPSHRGKLGQEGLKMGEPRFMEGLRSLSRPPPRAADYRGVVLKYLQEPSKEPSSRAIRSALISGNELDERQVRHLLELC